eukprot:CAMPEP_0115854704 /NCGR_PEP_ID=MMETSP0287-20121206/14163_1 /TAXON_ID=412157 /ORGANISM="Chrysochromulina rotalis, Strain UIO044" /LENGTH=167 /DNA_ID=CAMNT_0003308833 /DNA_START=18 /DNA_END=521 /DNA_ORIENTATION=+
MSTERERLVLDDEKKTTNNEKGLEGEVDDGEAEDDDDNENGEEDDDEEDSADETVDATAAVSSNGNVLVQWVATYGIGGGTVWWLWEHLDGVSRGLSILFAIFAAMSIHNGTWMQDARQVRRGSFQQGGKQTYTQVRERPTSRSASRSMDIKRTRVGSTSSGKLKSG